MNSGLYKETFSKVKSSYTVDIKDFEERRGRRGSLIRKIGVIAAAVALLAAFTVTASATGFFGISEEKTPTPEKTGDIASLDDYLSTPENMALTRWLMSDGSNASYAEAAKKYGLRVHEKFVMLTESELSENAGEFRDERHSGESGFMHEDGSFYTDGEFNGSGGSVSYRLARAVRGSMTDFMPTMDKNMICRQWLRDEGDQTVLLLLGGERSVVIADLGTCLVTVDVHAGTGGGFQKEDLEELADSFEWGELARQRPVELPEEEYMKFGAGVTLEEEKIIREQSFTVPLNGWGKITFISYAPSGRFEDVRFFLSRDGATSDYELHPVLTGLEFRDVAAVSFEDVSGDGFADIIVIIDYAAEAGEPYRETRIYTARGEGVFSIDWELTKFINSSINMDDMDIYAIRKLLKA